MTTVVLVEFILATVDTFPVHDENCQPEAGVAVILTVVPTGYSWFPKAGVTLPLPLAAIIKILLALVLRLALTAGVRLPLDAVSE
jgi:hypothetical protein